MIERSDELVTVFGGGGFIGRYVSEFLLRSGVRVRIAQRNPEQAYIIQPLAQVGQFGLEQVDIADAASVRRVVHGSDAVVNLVGIFGAKMRAVHVDGARNVAEAAREFGVRSLVQISAIGASRQSPSNYGQTKAEGEEAVRIAYPEATIIRPSLVFGPEDDLTNRFAAMARLPVLPVIAAQRRFQPVYVRDLGTAIAMAALEPSRFAGRTYEIGGPQPMSMIELHKTVLEITGQDPDILRVPDLLASLLASFGWLPGAPLTRDQWQMLQRDNLPSGELPGLNAFGIKPTPLGAVGMEWLGRFNRRGKFAGRRINLTATN
jgi:NADH dehydrogenase